MTTNSHGRVAYYPADLAIVIADLGAGGAQRVATNLAAGLASRGWSVSLITLAADVPDHFTLPPAVHRIGLDLAQRASGVLAALAANIGRVVALRRAIRVSAAPVVLSLVGTTNVLSVLACSGLGIRLVISERNDPSRQSLGRAWDWLRRRLYRRADTVTANSAAAIAALATYVPNSKLVQVPNPLIVPDMDPEPELPLRSHRILCVGRLSHQKAQDILLPAFARALPSAPDWRLALVGTGDREAGLRALASKLGIGAQIDWIGATPDIWHEYRNSDVLALPSRHEGMPNVVLEAMAFGVPVIVSDAAGGALDYVVDGTSGLIVRNSDVDSLTSAMVCMMTAPALRSRLGSAGRERVRSLLPDAAFGTWERVLGLTQLDLL